MYPVHAHAAALQTVLPAPNPDRYPWGRVLTRLKQAHHAAHGSEVVLYIGRADFARLEDYASKHAVSASAGATHCQLRGHLSYPIILTVPTGVGGERA